MCFHSIISRDMPIGTKKATSRNVLRHARSFVAEATCTRKKGGYRFSSQVDKDIEAAQPGAIRLFALPCPASFDGNGACVAMPDLGYNVGKRGARTPFAGRVQWCCAVERRNQMCAMYAKPMPCRGYSIVGKKVQSRLAVRHLGSGLFAALANSQMLLERHRHTEC